MTDLQVISLVLAAFIVGAMHGYHIAWLKHVRKIFIGKREAR